MSIKYKGKTIGTGVTSFNGRTGDIVPQPGDYTAAMVGAATPSDVSAVSAVANANKQTLEKTSISSKSITMLAEELPAFIASLPRFMTESITINVSGGVLTSQLQITNFYGPGVLNIFGLEQDRFKVQNGISVSNNSIYIYINNMIIEQSSTGTYSGNSMIYGNIGKVLSLSNVEIIGTDKTKHGITAGSGLVVNTSDLSIHGCDYPILVSTGAYVSVNGVTDRNDRGFYDNQYGGYVWRGGTISISDSSLSDTLGGSSNYFQGGTINNFYGFPIVDYHVPYKSVTVEAADLSNYLLALPRLLTENLTVEVNAGTAPDGFVIQNFYGPGSLTVKAKDDAKVTCSQRVHVGNCSIPVVTLQGIAIVANASLAYAMLRSDTSYVHAIDCSVTGEKKSDQCGVFASAHGALMLQGCSITNFMYGALATYGGRLTALDCTGADNTIGFNTALGGIIIASGSTPDTLGGSSNLNRGGLIVKADGTLV